jgi:hypothetical protein
MLIGSICPREMLSLSKEAQVRFWIRVPVRYEGTTIP